VKRNVEKRIAALELQVFENRCFEEVDQMITETLMEVSDEDLHLLIAAGDSQQKGREQTEAESGAFLRFNSLLNKRRRSPARRIRVAPAS
jgi:uncharacterized coiled-coil protein SlyX